MRVVVEQFSIDESDAVSTRIHHFFHLFVPLNSPDSGGLTHGIRKSWMSQVPSREIADALARIHEGIHEFWMAEMVSL